MLRAILITATALTLCLRSAIGAPQENWAGLADELSSHDRAISDPAHARLATEILPRLSDEKLESLIPEVAGLVVQLNRTDNERARQLAAVLLMGITQYRADSGAALSSAFPALIEHAENDTLPEINRNSLLALSVLNPSIPPEVLPVLLRIMEAPGDSTRVSIAAYGVARMAGTRPEAAAALDRALSNSGEREVAAIKAIGNAYVTDGYLESRLGPLLAASDQEVVKATLEALGKLGVPAIRLNSVQIEKFSKSSGDEHLAALARELLARQVAGQ